MAKHWARVGIDEDSTVSSAAMIALLDHLRVGPPALAALRFITHLVPVEYISLVAYAGGGAPTQLEGHARSSQVQDTTARCFSLYRFAFFREDEVTALAGELASLSEKAPRVDMFHYRQRDIPNRDWRNEIFVRERLAGRVSLVFAGAGHRAYALNLYRHTAAGEFESDELDRLRAVAPIVRAVLQPRLDSKSRTPDANRVTTASIRLGQQSDRLSKRELEVAARIAAGLSTDGIAQDLGIATSTVLTLRKRAYAKLNVHSRMTLAWGLDIGDSPSQSLGTDAHCDDS